MKRLLLLTAIILTTTSQVKSQWTAGPPPFNRFGNGASGPPATQWRGFGLGDFAGAGLNPLSALHINTNLLLPTPNFTPGEVFRTDCPTGAPTFWRMYNGGFQKGAIFYDPSSGTGNDLTIAAVAKGENIIFNTAFATSRMIIRDGIPANTAGFIGMGLNFLNPQHLLDVRGGDINTGDGTTASVTGYMIGDLYVLRHNGFINDIFVGVGAGNSTMTGHQNTLAGNNAGNALTGGQNNTAVGFHALQITTTGQDNIAIGFHTLQSNIIGGGNVAIGSQALEIYDQTFSPQHDGSIAVGFQAQQNCSTAFQNIAIGYQALQQNVDGIQNVAIGYLSLRNTVGVQAGANAGLGEENTAVGNETMTNNTTGHRNVAFGDDVLNHNISGSYNVAIGSEVMGDNTTGKSNTGVGHRCLERNLTGDCNSALGDSAGYYNVTGNFNTFSGFWAGISAPGQSQSNNSFYGYKNGMNITTGSSNAFMGYKTGLVNTTGSRNTLVGQQANLGATLNGLIDATAIGSEAIVTDNHKMILGNDTVRVGIGLSNDITTTNFYGPNNKLEIDAGLNGHNPSSGGFGKSGLRFRDLHAGGPSNYQGLPIAPNFTVTNQFNPPAVLSVDVNGDVILVPDAMGVSVGALLGAHNGTSISTITPNFVSFGNDLAATIGQLLNNREVPTNNFNVLFSDPSFGGGVPLSVFGNTYSFGRFNTLQTQENPKMYTHTDKEESAGMFVTDAANAPSCFAGVLRPQGGGGYGTPLGPTGAIGFVYGGNCDFKTGLAGVVDGAQVQQPSVAFVEVLLVKR